MLFDNVMCVGFLVQYNKVFSKRLKKLSYNYQPKVT
jgi:hypothetical protein